MNTPVDPSSIALENLEILDGSDAVLDSAPLLGVTPGGARRNRQAFQAYGSDAANASGDGTLIVSEHTADVLIEATDTKTVWRRIAEIEAALNAAAKLRVGSDTITLAGSAGVQDTTAFTSNPSGPQRVTLAYIPTTQAATDGSNDLIGLL